MPAQKLTAGHRQRMRQKLLDKGASALSDEEWLEILLYYSIGRGDVKPQVKQLLAKFKHLGALAAAPIDQITEIEGVGEKSALLIKLLESLSHRTAKIQAYERPILSNWEAVQHYCITTLGHEKIEKLMAICLDNQNKIISDDLLFEGTIDRIAIFPREIVKLALHRGAAAIILVHNHPSGDTRPSTADIEMTTHVMRALKLVDIKLHDHLIVAGAKCISMRSHQLI